MHNISAVKKGRKLLVACVLILVAQDVAFAGAETPPAAGKPFMAELLLSAPATPVPEQKPTTAKTQKIPGKARAAAPKPLTALLRQPPARKPRPSAVTTASKTAPEQKAQSQKAQDQAAGKLAAIAPAAGPAAAGAVKAAAPTPKTARKAAAEHRGPLPARDAALYKKIFAAQAHADWQKADKLRKELRDDRLMGHVLAQRYLHPSYKAKFDELADWLALYNDHPGAQNIYRLANRRKPRLYEGTLPTPSSARVATGLLRVLSDGSDSYTPQAKRSKSAQKDIGRLVRAIRSDLADGAPSRAYKRLNGDSARRLLDSTEYDQLRALIASSYMYEGKFKKAAELAHASAARSGSRAPVAGWVSGLVAWREGDYKQSAAYFEQTASSRYASRWTVAAGAYWASRAHMRAGNVKEVSTWLRRAAEQPRTFYGLIATRSLGWDFDFNWDMPNLTASHRARLESLPAGRRAMALVAAGQYHLAEQELLRINARGDKDLREALLAYAGKSALPSFAMKMAEAAPHPGGGLYDAALYPLSPWEPKDGYRVDRALIHAIIRQESRFNPWAESHSGATGLMQLMPATAGHVVGHGGFRDAEGRHRLRDPQTNLNIGQRYVEELLKQDQISMDMFSLIMAYNAGPGKLRKWKRELSDTLDDPLLFIESIPLAETRAFVERVMANYWIYRLRMGQPTPSLDNVSGGRWAKYVRLDDMPGTKPQKSPQKTAFMGWNNPFRMN